MRNQGSSMRGKCRMTVSIRAFCVVAPLSLVALLPGVAQAGVGASAVPSFPPVVTVGASGLEASIELRNTNTDDNAADINTVCNAGDPAPCPVGARGIVLTRPAPRRALTRRARASTRACSPSRPPRPAHPARRARTRCSTSRSADAGERHRPLHPARRPRDAAGLGRGVPDRLHLQRGQGAHGRPEPGRAGHPDRPGGGERPAQRGAPRLRARHERRRHRPARDGRGSRPAASGTVEAGGQLTDTATVTGLVSPVPGATVDFRLYGPDDANCSRPPVFESLGRPVAAGGTAVSEPFTAKKPRRLPLARVLQRRREQRARRRRLQRPGREHDRHARAAGRHRRRPARGDRADEHGQQRAVREDGVQAADPRSRRRAARVKVKLDGATIKTSEKARFTLPREGAQPPARPPHAEDRRPRRGRPDRPARDVLPLQAAGAAALRRLSGVAQRS